MRYWLAIVVCLLLSSTVGAHGNILYAVSLDFDEELKSGVTQAAQEYLKIQDNPVKFDYIKELIVVHFNEGLELSVLVHPETFEIYGFRDEQGFERTAPEISEEERRNKAEEAFRELPLDIQTELRYGEEQKTYRGSYIHSWYRYVGDINVFGERFEIEMNADGTIFAREGTLFFFSKETLEHVRPALPHTVANWIPLLQFDAQAGETLPVLIINRNRPMWVTSAKKLYPIFVGVDALDGRIVFTGGLREPLPPNYDAGRDMEVQPNEFAKQFN